MRAGIVLTLLSAALVAVAGCGGAEETGSGQTVVAAFYPVAFAAEQIAPGADVENLTPAGAEPHDLELSPRDVERVQDADVVLYLGEGFMPALQDAVADGDNSVDLLAGQQLREATEAHGHGEEEAEHEEEEESGLDPHVWLNPMRYTAMVRKTAQALDEPDAASDLVARLEGLVDEVEEEGATTVFFETLVSPKLAQTVAREAGVDTAVLNPLEGLTEEQIDEGADYFSIMRENLAALHQALGCT